MSAGPVNGRDAAEAEGFLAAAKGKQSDACPYACQHPDRGAWLVGWALAKARGAFVITVRAPTDEDRAEFAAMLAED